MLLIVVTNKISFTSFWKEGKALNFHVLPTKNEMYFAPVHVRFKHKTIFDRFILTHLSKDVQIFAGQIVHWPYYFPDLFAVVVVVVYTHCMINNWHEL